MGSGEISQQLIIDPVSAAYFERDGYSECQGSFNLSLATVNDRPLPLWLKID